MIEQEYFTFAKAFQAEHRELGSLLQRLRRALGNGRPWSASAARDASRAIEELQTHLRHHFAQEEEGGYLEQALVAAPRFSGQATELLQQHPVMVAQVAEAVRTARRATSDSTAWPVLKEQVKKLLGSLVAHEKAENAIVQQAFNTGVES
ncbi:MAG TPA: hemerythrin domain-containing protein [Pirellulales bacterium]|nr:hemerythrin domain-containing protein [Pirellulales bacterium]